MQSCLAEDLNLVFMLKDVGSPGEPKTLAFLFSRADFYLLVIDLFIIQNGNVFHSVS